MRVVSWNVRSLRDSAEDVVAVVRSLDPDVLCLQELPRLFAPRRAARRLAASCDLVVASAGRPAAEVAILVRPGLRVVATLRAPLPWRLGQHRRGLALAVLDVDDVSVVVGSTHLGLSSAEREQQAAAVLGRLAETRPPVILAGDFNETPEDSVWKAIAGHYVDAWAERGEGDGRTFSTARPRRRIDGVFVDRRLEVIGASVLADRRVERATDHRPVLADVRLPTFAV